jgi:hypothetical protein
VDLAKNLRFLITQHFKTPPSPDYVANDAVLVQNFMSLITLFWCHISTPQNVGGATIFFVRSANTVVLVKIIANK